MGVTLLSIPLQDLRQADQDGGTDPPPEPVAREPAPPAPPTALGMPLAGLALLAVLTPLHGIWVAQLVIVPLLVILPGVLLLRALRVPGATIAATPVYVPAASLLVLFVSGLVVDLGGRHLLGIAVPLRAAPLLVGLELICLALLLAGRRALADTLIPWTELSPRKTAWPLLIPLLSAAGALRLNSGHSGRLADVAVVVVIAAAVAGFLFAHRCTDKLLLTGVFALALAMMWSFSLRGNLVYGFDISSEYYSLMQTVTSGVWHVSHPNDAYGAMLSVTVLPAELHALSGVPALLVFKVIYPVFGALFPVAVFILARRVLNGRWAFMAAALVLMQQTLFQQMPALARQEVATLLFAALMLAVLDTSLARRSRWALTGLLSLGVVVSHYSTAYLAITLLGMAIVFQWAASWFRPVPRLTGAALLAVVVAIGGTGLWYTALTHSASNVSQFIATAEEQGINLLPNQGANPLATYLQGESEQAMTPAQYQSYLNAYFKKNDKFIRTLPDATAPRYDLRAAPAQSPPVTAPGAASALNLVSLVIQQLLNLLAGVCALILALRRKEPLIVRQIGLLGLAGMIILVLARLSGTIAQEYNPERAFLQMMIVLAVGICWLFQRTAERWRRTGPVILAVTALGFGLFMAGSSGLSGVAFGGGTPANLADNGNDYQQFVKTTPDLAAAAWVNHAAPPSELIYADNYAKLLLDTVASNRPGVFDAITPETIDQHAWVYATSVNVLDDVVRSLSVNQSASYALPAGFLFSNFDLVYTNGSSEVFHH